MTTKLEIACELLNEALIMYYKGGSDFACLHLAGGAEEVLGQYLRFIGGESSFKGLHSGSLRMYQHDNKLQLKSDYMTYAINYTKNSVKHMDDLEDRYFNGDIRKEAKDRLEMAISNYYNLMSIAKGSEAECLKETALIKRFNSERTS